MIPVAGRIALAPGDGTDGGFSLGAAGELAVRYDKSGALESISGYDDNALSGASAAIASASGGPSAHTAKGKSGLDTLQEAVDRFAAERLDDETASISYSHPLAYAGSIEFKVAAHRGSVPSRFFHYKPPQIPKTCTPIPPELQKILDDANALAAQIAQLVDDIVNGFNKNTEIYLREDLGPKLGKAAQQALQDAENKLEGLGAQLGNQITNGIAGSGGSMARTAAATANAPTMSAELLVDGAPALAAANADGVVPLTRGRQISVRFTVSSLDQLVHGGFQYGYYQNAVTLGSDLDDAGAQPHRTTSPAPTRPSHRVTRRRASRAAEAAAAATSIRAARSAPARAHRSAMPSSRCCAATPAPSSPRSRRAARSCRPPTATTRIAATRPATSAGTSWRASTR